MPYVLGSPLEPTAKAEGLPTVQGSLQPIASVRATVQAVATPTASTLPLLGPRATVTVLP